MYVTGELQSPDRERKKGFDGEFIGGDSRRTSDKSVGSSENEKSYYFFVSSHIFLKIIFAPKLFNFPISHPILS